ncbi:MAG: hypothetical protein H6838_10720 [Planctomycetes bacterium]|nr:hypothetical protein [Planctomycetota bacterium]MCB9885959.1 hypothetical protein [Planctomycetota bacterium]
MNTTCSLLLSTLLASSLISGHAAAQGAEWVTNGSFTGTLAPWTLGGAYSVNPGLESGWDTTGFGVSDCYGVNAGGQVTPAPYPPNWVEQQILVIQGLTYEFRCDASGSRPGAPTVGNADIGTVYVEVDNVEVARHAFGSYVASPTGTIKRAQLCGRFTPTTTGQVTLRIYTERRFLGGAANPRMNIDNVSVIDVSGPTYWVAGNRQIGGSVTHSVRGTPNALFGTVVALGENLTGIPFPGVTGLFLLDPLSAVTLQIGVLDAAGESDTPMTLPNNQLFTTIPLYHQAGMIDLAPSLGLHFGIFATP